MNSWWGPQKLSTKEWMTSCRNLLRWFLQQDNFHCYFLIKAKNRLIKMLYSLYTHGHDLTFLLPECLFFRSFLYSWKFIQAFLSSCDCHYFVGGRSVCEKFHSWPELCMVLAQEWMLHVFLLMPVGIYVLKHMGRKSKGDFRLVVVSGKEKHIRFYLLYLSIDGCGTEWNVKSL